MENQNHQPTTVLLLEDDPLVGDQICFTLRANGYIVEWCESIRRCEHLLSNNTFDLAIFDVDIQGDNSIDFFVRQQLDGYQIPTIFLSANGTQENVRRVLEAGGNDFIHKPIDNYELLLRLKAHLRLLGVTPSFKFAKAELDIQENILTEETRKVALSERQMEILAWFFKHPEQTIQRDHLLENLSQSEAEDHRTLDSHISQVRRKMRDKKITSFNIQAVYGVGYRLSLSENSRYQNS